MNYKRMQRPMFMLGGSARKDYQNGTENPAIKDIEELIKQRGAARERSISGIKSILPLQVLAGTTGLSQIRSPRDVLSVLSEIGTSPTTFGALGRLASLDMTAKDKDLADRIALAKIKQDSKGSSTRLKSEGAIRRIETKIINLENEKKALEGQTGPEVQKRLDKINEDLRIEKQSLKAFINENLRQRAVDKLAEGLFPGQGIEDIKEEDIQRLIDKYKGRGMQDGGRVDFQEGTPDPTLPQPKPVEAVDDRKLENMMEAAPALENPGEVRDMAFNDPKRVYESLRRRLPKEIPDDVVRIIAYNQEAFADFADISDQSDVDSFNEKYNVQLVIPVEEVS